MDTVYTVTTTNGTTVNESAASYTKTGTATTRTVPDSNDAGNVLRYNTATTALTLTLDQPVTLGSLKTTNTGVFTLNSGTLTLDGTGMSATNNGFSNAGVASLLNSNTTASGLTVNSAISFGATALDIGTTGSGGSVLIGGSITATAAQNLNFRINSQSAATGVTVTGGIGTSGSAIAISNLGTNANAGAVLLSGILGTSVSGVTQNSAASTLVLTGANTFSGGTTLTQGTLQAQNNGATNVLQGLGTGTVTLNGGLLNLRASGCRGFFHDHHR